MNRKKDVTIVAINAMVACVYAVMTMAISPFAYGAIQARISEVIVFLAFYNKKFFPGLIIGCLIANIPSVIGLPDMIFGTLSTFFVCLAMYQLKNIYIAVITGGMITGIVIGAELYFVLGLPFFINALYVFIGEVIVLFIGAMLFQLLEKNSIFMKKYIYES